MSRQRAAAWLAAVLLAAPLSLAGPLSPGAQGQVQASPSPTWSQAREPGADLVVYLMTMGEGDLVWERFGHNAIWIHDPVAGTDHTYHWGLFDFDEPGFIREFVQGRMYYSMGAAHADDMVRAYMRANRSVWIQELELMPRQRQALADFVAWNIRPENRFYHYDYYHDNCSTRVRDALDRALGGQILAQTGGLPSGYTFRDHTRRVTTNDLLTYTGLMAGLSQGVDHEISVWEEMFLPLSMRERVRHITVTDDDGRELPLVRSEQTLFVADRPPLRQQPPRWWPGYLLVGLAAAMLILGTGHLAARSVGARGVAARAGAGAIGGLWMLAAGLLGVVLVGLWGFTDHAAAYRNENLLLFNPLALPLAVLFPLLMGGRGGARLERWTVGLALVVAVAGVLGVVFKLLPWFHQVNGELLALAVPIHMAVAAVSWLLVHQRTGPGRDAGPAHSGTDRITGSVPCARR